jgi:hypothetical protein
MMARRPPPREGLVEEIGGIRIMRRRAPGWLLIAIAAVVSWGLFYIITYSVTEAGSFEAPASGVIGTALRLAGL